MKKDKDLFSEEYVKKHRRFPVFYTVLLCVLVVIQLALLCVIVFYRPQPDDVIERYDLEIKPYADGSLDITYHIRWCVMEGSEPLTWVSIGLANGSWTYYPESLSHNIAELKSYEDEYAVYADVTFYEPVEPGEVIEFSFKINQKNMLCKDSQGKYFYEFVPGWFNAIDVEAYTFRWLVYDFDVSSNAPDSAQGWLLWSGSMPHGTTVPLRVIYGEEVFDHPSTVTYSDFDDSGVYDELAEDRSGVITFCVFVMILLALVELFVADCYVSYARGRGFLTGYGHHVHVYGRRNPAYVAEKNKHRSRGGGFSGGGCACACACACAGGGRAGCSQKDTYKISTPKI
ncbi:MAG: hypothetical protein IKC75_04145 [Clostridia bacterium]|nr:hypothetical protein [Clostridia bacterium]